MKYYKLFFIGLFFAFHCYSQKNEILPNLSIEQDKAISDSIVYITIKLMNNSNKTISIENPEACAINAFRGSNHWEIKLQVNNQIFYPRNYFNTVISDKFNTNKKIKKNNSISFNVPIDFRIKDYYDEPIFLDDCTVQVFCTIFQKDTTFTLESNILKLNHE